MTCLSPIIPFAAVANRLIQLMESPCPDVEEIVQVVSSGSVLTAKILQLAISSLFSYCHRIIQAAISIGYNGMLATALSFTLVQHFRKEGAAGLNLDLFWRRSLVVASACRAIGDACLRTKRS